MSPGCTKTGGMRSALVELVSSRLASPSDLSQSGVCRLFEAQRVQRFSASIDLPFPWRQMMSAAPQQFIVEDNVLGYTSAQLLLLLKLGISSRAEKWPQSLSGKGEESVSEGGRR